MKRVNNTAKFRHVDQPKRGFSYKTSKRTSFTASICGVLLAILHSVAAAASNIDSGSTYSASNIGGSVNPDFKGGTLKIDSATTINQAFVVEDYSTNTIDAYGNAATLSGAFTGLGPLTFTDSIGGGNVTFTSSANAYSGATTINSGAVLTLAGSGTISASSGIADNGTLDISPTTSGASLISLSGSGAVTLGAQSLTLTEGAGTFAGTISGTGGLILTGGTEILTGANGYTGGTTITGGTLEIGDGGTIGSIVGNVANAGTLEFNRADDIVIGTTISGGGGLIQAGVGTLTLTASNGYSGATTISAGTLALSGSGSIASSSIVTANGTLDISATTGTSIVSLSGAGTVQLGAQTLTLTAATGTFSGVIAGTGGLVLNGGTELLSGADSFTGPTTVNAGTLEVGASTVAYNVADSGIFAFDSSAAISMTGMVSGSGGVSQLGAGVTTISAPQSYTGVTTITSGTLALSAGGSIATSSGVVANGTFDISAATGGASITSLSGSGGVQLGVGTLALTNASGAFSGVIAGTGGFTLAGGNETLSGSNTYTGVTTVASGTLYLGNPNSLATSSNVVDNGGLDISGVTTNGSSTDTSIVSLSGGGIVTLGTKTLILTGANGTFSGTVSGTGGLTVSGGTETLSGANSYTGVTTISAGTLVLSGTGSLATTGTVADSGVFDISAATAGGPVTLGSLAGSGTVNIGANNLNLINASTAFSGNIFGTGALTVSGGAQILSGANTYTGGTTISAGTLQIGQANSSGSITGNVIDNGTLAFDRSDSTTFSGTISGTGGVTQIGNGTTALVAANTYTGGTTITAGTLQIGNGATTGSISGNVADSGTLAFDHSDAITFGATISGTGAVVQIGTGSLALTAVNNYTGATTIGSGAVMTLGSSGSIAASSGVIDNGTFDVSATTITPQIASLAGTGAVTLGSQSLTLTNASGSFSGVISGSGGLLLTGGAQTLSGTDNYTGTTTINGGLLTVTGSIASSRGVTVNSGGTLAGTGTVPTVTLNSGSTIAPGVAGTGTLNVNGTVAFASGSNFVINLSSASTPRLSVSGAETAAGTLSVASTDGTYFLGQKVAILTAGDGVTGSFTAPTIPSTGAEFSSNLSYDANNVYLEIDLAKLSPLLPATASVNQVNAVGGIDAAIAAGDTLPTQFENLGNLSSAGLATDADQLAGELGSDVPQVSNALFDPFLTTIFNHMNDEQSNGSTSKYHPPLQQGTQVWMSGFAGTGIVSGDSGGIGTHELKTNLAGIVGGADWHISPNFTLGGALSAGTTTFHLADDLGEGKADAFQAGVYGFMQFTPRFYGSFAAALALDAFTTDRVLNVSGTDDLTGKVTTGVYGGRYETGVKLGGFAPYVALQDKLIQAPAYSETASSGSNTFALSYADHTNNVANFEAGFRQSTDIPLHNWIVRFSDRLAWSHEVFGTWDAHATFAGLPDSGFTSYGAEPARDSALISLGAELKNRNGLGLDFHMDDAISGNSQTYNEMVGLNYTW